MLRAVLAVTLAVALLGVAGPAIDDARTGSTERRIDGQLDALAASAETLRECEPAVDPGERGARRVRSLSLPAASVTSAPVEYVAIGGIPEGRSDRDTTRTDVLAYAVEGGRQHVELVDVPIRVAVRGEDGWTIRGDGEPLVLRGDGTARVTLTLVRLDGRPTVLVTADQV